MQGLFTESRLQEIVLESFRVEVNSLKPGNVSRFADGHGMTSNDFLKSAILVTPLLCDRGLSLGQRIHESVTVTQKQVGTNTNLGMLLLFAPLIMSAEKMGEQSVAAMQQYLQQTLLSIDKTDSGLVFEAIKTANPGGLGHSTKYDVTLNPDCGLLEAMAVAADRDAIARQFTTGFIDIFKTGMNAIKEFTLRWNSVEWAAVACYLTFLAIMPDSHIARKYGYRTAEQVRKKAVLIADKFKQNDCPEDARGALSGFDRELKETHINPGTSADLTAASILVFGLMTS